MANRLSDGLLAFWRFNEASGNRLDSYTGQYNLTAVTLGTGVNTFSVSGATANTDNAGQSASADWTGSNYVAWKYDATSFNHTSCTMVLALKITADTVSNNYWSPMGWIDTAVDANTIIGFDSDTTREWAIKVGDGSTYSRFKDSSRFITTGHWWYAVGRYRASDKLLKMDTFKMDTNVQSTSSATAAISQLRTNINESTTRFYIGKSNRGGYSAGAPAIYDHAAIWNRYLSDAEVTELYNSGNLRTYAYITASAPAGVSVTVI